MSRMPFYYALALKPNFVSISTVKSVEWLFLVKFDLIEIDST